MHKRHIITGAPGTGKTSLIDALQKEGYPCFAEISRQLIISQQEQNSDKTPWGNLYEFADLVYKQTIEELQLPIKKNTFVDRGLPDIIAYLQSKSFITPEYLNDFPYHKYYTPTVFLLPLWKEIYINDPQRPQSYQEASRIQKHLVDVYHTLGFTIKTLPKTTLVRRIDYIKSLI
ncbi:AAA family ATPase [Aquimarina aquimarini]|uniref:AAA family ATPase n=1 Tax=Aquimarina aquimarini TaxID=1191734 RepID=UPI000D55EA66|nr:AAA family ATPase [Aquimarina aquimarini]